MTSKGMTVGGMAYCQVHLCSQSHHTMLTVPICIEQLGHRSLADAVPGTQIKLHCGVLGPISYEGIWAPFCPCNVGLVIVQVDCEKHS